MISRCVNASIPSSDSGAIPSTSSIRDSTSPQWSSSRPVRGLRTIATGSKRICMLLLGHGRQFQYRIPIPCRTPRVQGPIDHRGRELRLPGAIGIDRVELPRPSLDVLPSHDFPPQGFHGRRRHLVLEAEDVKVPRVVLRFLGERIGLDDGVPLFGRTDEELELATQLLPDPPLQPVLHLGGGFRAFDHQIPALHERPGILELQLLARRPQIAHREHRLPPEIDPPDQGDVDQSRPSAPRSQLTFCTAQYPYISTTGVRSTSPTVFNSPRDGLPNRIESNDARGTVDRQESAAMGRMKGIPDTVESATRTACHRCADWPCQISTCWRGDSGVTMSVRCHPAPQAWSSNAGSVGIAQAMRLNDFPRGSLIRLPREARRGVPGPPPPS